MAAAAIGLAMLALVGGIAPLAAGALACALTWLYSVPPAQLKTRGVAGLWAYAGASALGFVGVPFAAAGGTGYNVGVLGLAVFADKWVNLHFHQVLDAESDGASAQGTYAVRVGVPHARRTLAAAVAVAVTAMLATAATTVSATDQKLAVALMLALAAALPIVHSRRRRGTARATPLDHELPPLYLGLTFAVFRALPLLLLAKTLFVSPAMLPVTGLALILCIVEGVQSLRYRHG
jgi:1,4-dihydroxy-2-naphthoate octaprenyltransferase